MISKYIPRMLLVASMLTLAIQSADAVAEVGAQEGGKDKGPVFGEFEAAGQIPGFGEFTIDQLAQRDDAAVSFIGAIATFVTAAIIVIALIAIVIGGYIYMTAAGSADRVTKAKTIIASALLGIVLAIAAYLILNTINPSLVPAQDPF